MGRRRPGTISLALGLLSVGLTLGVWVFIFTRAPLGAFRNQGGMLIALVLFPLTLLGWVVAGGRAITLGRRAFGEAGAHGGRAAGVAGIVLGVLGLLMSLGTCVVPEMLAELVFGR